VNRPAVFHPLTRRWSLDRSEEAVDKHIGHCTCLNFRPTYLIVMEHASKLVLHNLSSDPQPLGTLGCAVLTLPCPGVKNLQSFTCVAPSSTSTASRWGHFWGNFEIPSLWRWHVVCLCACMRVRVVAYASSCKYVKFSCRQVRYLHEG
jgi:hypothetical protein